MHRGTLCCSVVFFAHNALLLLGVWSHALEAYSCDPRYGQKGESVVLSPGNISERLSVGTWKFNETNIAVIDGIISGRQFTSRVSLDQKSYSLTIQHLKTTDSGDFTFVSATDRKQRQTICIRLQVQEALTQSPTLSVVNNTKALNESCVVFMECRSESDKNVSYRWTVNNRKINGSTLQYRLKPQEGDITVTCIVSNMVSEVSESKSINCKTPPTPEGFMGYLVIAGVAFSVFISVVVLVIFCRCKKAQAAAEADELTVYAEIQEVMTSKQTIPCSIYESPEDRHTTAQPKPQTVYDQIQFNRMQQP